MSVDENSITKHAQWLPANPLVPNIFHWAYFSQHLQWHTDFVYLSFFNMFNALTGNELFRVLSSL